jgi:hypothetical protein
VTPLVERAVPQFRDEYVFRADNDKFGIGFCNCNRHAVLLRLVVFPNRPIPPCFFLSSDDSV